jgi:hypothetical protein
VKMTENRGFAGQLRPSNWRLAAHA